MNSPARVFSRKISERENEAAFAAFSLEKAPTDWGQQREESERKVERLLDRAPPSRASAKSPTASRIQQKTTVRHYPHKQELQPYDRTLLSLPGPANFYKLQSRSARAGRARPSESILQTGSYAGNRLPWRPSTHMGMASHCIPPPALLIAVGLPESFFSPVPARVGGKGREPAVGPNVCENAGAASLKFPRIWGRRPPKQLAGIRAQKKPLVSQRLLRVCGCLTCLCFDLFRDGNLGAERQRDLELFI